MYFIIFDIFLYDLLYVRKNTIIILNKLYFLLNYKLCRFYIFIFDILYYYYTLQLILIDYKLCINVFYIITLYNKFYYNILNKL